MNTGHGIERSSALFRVEPRHPLAPTGLPNANDVSDIYRWDLIRRFDAAGNGVAFQWAPLARDQAANVDGMLFLTDVYDTAPASFGRPPLGAAAQPVKNGLDEFAHHAHLVWSAPNEFSRAAILSPIWRAVPPLHLLGVDITSKTLFGVGPRELVRRYHLGYDRIDVSWLFLKSVQLEGRCTAPIVEDANGLLPDTNCARLPPTTFEYKFPGLAREVVDGFETALFDGPPILKDTDGDAIPELMFQNGKSLIFVIHKPGSGPAPETEFENEDGGSAAWTLRSDRDDRRHRTGHSSRTLRRLSS